jgi:hypothetical protein
MDIIIRARSSLFEEPQLVWPLVSQIVPFLLWIEVDLDVLEDMAREDLVTDYEVLGIHCRTIAHFERPVPYSFSSRPAIWRESSWRSRCRELVWVFFDGD